jgi:hypothetical protein
MSDVYETVTPAGVEDKPAAVVPIHDSEKILREMPPEAAREIFGEEITAEWSPADAVKELHKKRGQQGEQPNNTVRFDRDGRRTEQQTDKQAAGDLSFSRRVEHANRLLEAMPRLDAERAVNTANEALTGGHIHQYALDDKDKAGPLEHGDDPKTAQQRLTALREQRASDLHALAEQLSQPVEQPPAEAAQLAEQQQQQPPSPQPEPPGQPDLVEQLRMQAEAEKTAYQQMRQATAVEFQLQNTAQQLDQQLTAKYAAQIQQAGGLTPEGLANFAKQNPAGFKELAEAQNLYNTCTANIEHCRQVTLLNQQRMAELQQAKARNEHAAWAKAQDDLVTKNIPELANPETAPALQRAALDTLKGAGITEQELRSLWNGEQTLNLRDHRAQAIISKAAKWDAAQAKAKSARPEPLPQVMRPGVALSKGEISDGDQSARLSRLGYLSPTDAMKEGAKLLSERRGRR